MPGTSRSSYGAFVYHVLNRGNGRIDVFHKDDDFAASVNLMREAHEKVPMRLTSFCLMPNHFHLLLWPHEDGDLSRWRQCLIVERSQDCEWSSLKPTARSGPDGLLCDGPILKPAQWTRHVNGLETEAELKALHHSLARGKPFGDTRWQTRTAADLGPESSLRLRGRPKRPDK